MEVGMIPSLEKLRRKGYKGDGSRSLKDDGGGV